MDGKPVTTKKAKTKVINAVDLFCGAGGTSSGLINAVNALGYDIKLTAINHWDVAIATHTKNHEDVEHFCQSIDTINPTDVVKGGRLQLLVASPECTHHSRARGGKPRSDQKRADAWLLMRWIEKLYVENILIENVKEFVEWGPLTAKGMPDKRHKGTYFRQFVEALKINYNVDYKIINCADHGDATTRERFFLIARRPKHKPIVWPERTHASRKEIAKMVAQPDLFERPTLKPWVAAREIIDWSLEGKSIFGRKKPLSPNTLKRIYAGLMKYSLKPFIVPQFSSPDTRDVEQPLGTVTTTSRGVGLAEPFLINLKNADRRDRCIDEPTFTQATANHQAVVEPFIVSTGHTSANGINARDIAEPVPSILASPRIGIVEPFLISAGGPELDAKTVEEPMRTVLTRDHQALVEPFLVKFHGGKHAENRNYPVDEPIGTLDTSNRFGLAEPFVIGQQSGATARSVEDPLPTVAGSGAIAMVEPFVVRLKNNQGAGDIDDPLKTLTTKESYAVAEPYIVKFYGNEKGAESIDDPLDTITGKDRFGLCIPSIGAVLDIRFRMLQPHELAAAMSFPKNYEFTGNREQKVKQIGNAVPLETAKALCKSLLG